jgi:hypothetical protein
LVIESRHVSESCQLLNIESKVEKSFSLSNFYGLQNQASFRLLLVWFLQWRTTERVNRSKWLSRSQMTISSLEETKQIELLSKWQLVEYWRVVGQFIKTWCFQRPNLFSSKCMPILKLSLWGFQSHKKLQHYFSFFWLSKFKHFVWFFKNLWRITLDIL